MEDRHAAKAALMVEEWGGEENSSYEWQHKSDLRTGQVHDYQHALALIAVGRMLDIKPDNRFIHIPTRGKASVHYTTQHRGKLTIDHQMPEHAADIHILAGPREFTGEYGHPWDIDVVGWVSGSRLASIGNRIIWPARSGDRKRIMVAAGKLNYMDKLGVEVSWWPV